MIKMLMLAFGLSIGAQAAMANARITVLMDLLATDDVVEILREEGFAYAAELDRDMLDGQGGAFWQAQVGQIYRADPISEMLRAALETGLSPETVEAAIAFFGTEQGARIVELENAARRAMSDPAVKSAAQDLYDDRLSAGDEMISLVARFFDANDLVERNVAGAMSANLQFFRGLSDGKLVDDGEAQMIAEVWSQFDEIRQNTEAWLNGFSMIAYSPLSQETLESYVAFSMSGEGRALNAALFEGFEGVYNEVSYALGRAIALSAEGDEI